MYDPEEQSTITVDDFEKYIHLWNLIPGGAGKGVILLKKLVDQIQYEGFYKPITKLPTILISGIEGKRTAAKALTNSFSIELDNCYEIHASFLDSIQSRMFFHDSIAFSAHIVHHIEQLNSTSQSIVYRFLKDRRCEFRDYFSKQYEYVHLNGMLILTTSNIDKVNKPILDAVDYIIELEPLSQEQLELVILQRLKFCDIGYESENILKEIIEYGNGQIKEIIKFLRTCQTITKADCRKFLTSKDIEMGRRLA